MTPCFEGSIGLFGWMTLRTLSYDIRKFESCVVEIKRMEGLCRLPFNDICGAVSR